MFKFDFILYIGYNYFKLKGGEAVKHSRLKYTYNVIGFALIIFLTLRESLSVILLHTPLQKGTPLFIFLSIIVYILACFIPVVAMENMLGIHPLLFKKVKPMDAAATSAFGYFILFVAGILNSGILALFKKLGLEFSPAVRTIPDGTLAAILYFVYICMLPPLLEEIFIRGLVLNSLKSWGVPFAVGISSVIFALMHSSLHNFLLYFICGVVLAKIYLAFDSLWPGILLHFVNNTLSFVMLGFQQRANAVSAVSLMIYIYVMTIILGYAGLKYIQKNKINLAFSFVRTREIGTKVKTLFKSYAGLGALCLLLFLAAYQSFRALI